MRNPSAKEPGAIDLFPAGIEVAVPSGTKAAELCSEHLGVPVESISRRAPISGKATQDLFLRCGSWRVVAWGSYSVVGVGAKRGSQSPNWGISNQLCETSTPRDSRVSTCIGLPNPCGVMISSFT